MVLIPNSEQGNFECSLDSEFGNQSINVLFDRRINCQLSAIRSSGDVDFKQHVVNSITNEITVSGGSFKVLQNQKLIVGVISVGETQISQNHVLDFQNSEYALQLFIPVNVDTEDYNSLRTWLGGLKFENWTKQNYEPFDFIDLSLQEVSVA